MKEACCFSSSMCMGAVPRLAFRREKCHTECCSLTDMSSVIFEKALRRDQIAGISVPMLSTQFGEGRVPLFVLLFHFAFGQPHRDIQTHMCNTCVTPSPREVLYQHIATLHTSHGAKSDYGCMICDRTSRGALQMPTNLKRHEMNQIHALRFSRSKVR